MILYSRSYNFAITNNLPEHGFIHHSHHFKQSTHRFEFRVGIGVFWNRKVVRLNKNHRGTNMNSQPN